MQGKHLYEYAVIRIVPAVEREEFINVGVIVFSKNAKYIKVLMHLNESRILNFSSLTDIEDIRCNLDALCRIAQGKKEAGPIAQMDLASRFRWLTAVRSSVIQTSRPHPGMCEDLDATTERLFNELVM